MKYQEKCELLDKQKLTTDIFKYRIKTDKIDKEAKPGQFLEIRVSDSVEPFLRRPISIYSIALYSVSSVLHIFIIIKLHDVATNMLISVIAFASNAIIDPFLIFVFEKAEYSMLNIK